MAVHACLKKEFMEDKKCHNLVSWLKLYFRVGNLTPDLEICVIFQGSLVTYPLGENFDSALYPK